MLMLKGKLEREKERERERESEFDSLLHYVLHIGKSPLLVERCKI